jgi:DNA repair exonuclease SbcCD nuclease subunit
MIERTDPERRGPSRGGVRPDRTQLRERIVVRLLLLADLHLGARLLAWKERAEELHAEIERSWVEAVDLALSSAAKVEAVLIAGDLFDRPVPQDSHLELVQGGLERLGDADIPTVLLPGTHDGLYSPSSVYRTACWPSNVTLVTERAGTRVSLLRGDTALHIHTQAPVPGEEIVPLAAIDREEHPGVHIGLFHALLEDSPYPMAWHPAILNAAAVEEAKLDLIVLGGPHEAQEALWEDCPLVTPGAPVGLRPGNRGEPCWTIAEVGETGARVERCPRRVVSLHEAPSEQPVLRTGTGDEFPLEAAFVEDLTRRREAASDRMEQETLDLAIQVGLRAFRRSGGLDAD